MLQVSENEISVLKRSGGTAQLYTLEGTLPESQASYSNLRNACW